MIGNKFPSISKANSLYLENKFDTIIRKPEIVVPGIVAMKTQLFSTGIGNHIAGAFQHTELLTAIIDYQYYRPV